MSLSPPVVVYPNTVTTQPGPHSKGSFGPVFIVLAVVIVLAVAACCVSQICSRRFSQTKGRRDCNYHPKESDLEFGFKNGIPTAKPVGHGKHKEPRHAENGGTKGEPKHTDNLEARTSA